MIFGVTTRARHVYNGIVCGERESPSRPRARRPARADLYSAGTLVTSPGGHGTEYGFPIPAITAADQADAFVAARSRKGQTTSKLSMTTAQEVGLAWKTIDKPTLAAVIRAAKARRNWGVVHVLAREFARTAIEGARRPRPPICRQTGGQRLRATGRRQKAFVIPTLTVLDGVIRGGGNATLADDTSLAPYLTPNDVQMLRSGFPARTGADVLKIPSESVEAS